MAVPSTSRAAVGLRLGAHYQRHAFVAGLKRCGFVIGPPLPHPGPNDLLLIWNRAGLWDHHASRYEAAGARVVVTENGYLGRDPQGGQLFALALGHHLGAGQWNTGDGSRFAALGIELSPWRTGGDDVVVLPQRGIGEHGVAMPRNWTEDVVRRLRQRTGRKIRVRVHPGMSRSDPLPDLGNCWAAVTWGSGAGLKAIVHGVPVFHELPQWLGSSASRLGIDDIENPFLGDRLPMLNRLAWAQWSAAEIESGRAFRHLLG